MQDLGKNKKALPMNKQAPQSGSLFLYEMPFKD